MVTETGSAGNGFVMYITSLVLSSFTSKRLLGCVRFKKDTSITSKVGLHGILIME